MAHRFKYPDGELKTAKPHGGAFVDYNGPAAKLRIDPDQNVIVGLANIKRYIGVRSNSTIWRWIEIFSFPAVKRPDGLWMTTMTAIDQWIFLASESAVAALQRNRATNVKAQLALERLQKHIADGTIDREAVRVALKTGKHIGLVAPERDLRPRNIDPNGPKVYKNHNLEKYNANK